jgi:hypothetical protein
VFENRVLRIIGSKRDVAARMWTKCITCTLLQYDQNDNMRGVRHECGRGTRIGYWWGSQRGRDHKPEGKRPLERSRHRHLDNIKMNLGEVRWVVLTGLICVKIGASGERL